MASINALRSLALADRAKEDILEKIPGFYNSVSQALGSAITGAQDNTQSVMDQRIGAANGLLAKVKQTIDGKGGIVETGINNAIDTAGTIVDTIIFTINSNVATTPTTALQITEVALKAAELVSKLAGYEATLDAAKYDYLQWSVQAGYTNGNDIIAPAGSAGALEFASIGARGMATHRDALMPRFTNRRNNTENGNNYSAMYNWASVGGLAHIGRYNVVA